MPRLLLNFLNLLRARLSSRIALWVFVSIVIIEIIILWPSTVRREYEVMNQLEQVSIATLDAVARFSEAHTSAAEILEKAQMLAPDFPILGGTLYNQTGKQLSQFGEQPQLAFNTINNIIEPYRQRTVDNTRYDVALPVQPNSRHDSLAKALAEQHCRYIPNVHAMPCQSLGSIILVLRISAQKVNEEVEGFVWRIAGLVVIICLFVTVSMLFVLAILVINPILQLRTALTSISEVTNDAPNIKLLRTQRCDELGDVMRTFNNMAKRLVEQVSDIKDREKQLTTVVNELCEANTQAEKLLLNILPIPIATQLKQGVYPIAESFPEATVLFADIVGFTQLSAQTPPAEMVELLNQLFTTFDHLAEHHGLEKIKTIGDAYMVVGGLPVPSDEHVEAVANMALDMLRDVQTFSGRQGTPLSIRIGINTGPVVAGVIGVKKFIYDLWGDTVNTASRMESHGLVNTIQVTESTYLRLKDKYQFQSRGTIAIKGKGDMATYLLQSKTLVDILL
ncbi:adenylate/guanylate cyclase domain-containing protein [Beggiatoa leptomitoformis]|uniref:Adenylate cyclase n=1 Tax=Beggiatoa leptomitoformis TaxID=288004 RepID=A0A2N9YHH9_9GAMM|nr:adenylate/guanylate cyclase domain-containing protein [Beggiatoa leptomitoformis]ALG67793.1 HAMP domain-containing protein [Beggiatoa leptomitoformis]AUI69960.1 HAMP domain-containing protein [Beggiatoa leptomitoformis]